MEPSHSSSRLPGRSLAAIFAGGAAWFILARIVGVGISVATIAVLARLISPAEFGKIAVALTVLTLPQVLLEGFLGFPIIQPSAFDRRMVSALFGAALIGALLFVLAQIALFAPLLESLLRIQGLASILVLVAPVVVIRVVTVACTALLLRSHRFAQVSLILMVSNVFGYAIPAIILALDGWGAAAVAMAMVASAALEATVMLLTVRGLPSPTFSLTAIVGVWSFAASGAGSRAINWASANVDTIIVASALGPAALGLYSRSYNLFVQIKELFDLPMRRVLGPVLSTLQSDPQRLRAAVSSLLLVSIAGAGTVSVYFASNASAIIEVLLGPDWAAAEATLAILFAGLVPRVGYLVLESVAISLRLSKDLLVLATMKIGAIGLLCLVGSMFGLSGVAMGLVGAYALSYGIAAVLVARKMGMRIDEFTLSHLPGLSLACAVALVLGCLTWIVPSQAPALQILSTGCVVFAMALLAAYALPDRWLDIGSALSRRRLLDWLKQGARGAFSSTAKN